MLTISYQGINARYSNGTMGQVGKVRFELATKLTRTIGALCLQDSADGKVQSHKYNRR